MLEQLYHQIHELYSIANRFDENKKLSTVVPPIISLLDDTSRPNNTAVHLRLLEQTSHSLRKLFINE